MKIRDIREIATNNRFKIATWFVVFLFTSLVVLSINVPKVSYGALITSSAGIATIYYGLIKYWMDEDLMFKSFFEVFNKRFEDINKDLNAIMEGQKPQNKFEKVVQDYLNLCAEEFYWFKKGRIPKKVWDSWLNGIHYYLRSKEIKEYFKDQANWDESYYGFLSEISNSLK